MSVLKRLFPTGIAFFALFVATPAAGQSATTVLENLDWMSGCWLSESPRRSIEEHWMRPLGGTLFGVNRTVAGGRTVASEFLQIREVRPDTLGYVAAPSGQAVTTFLFEKASEGGVSFWNPDHDFPQRISYKLAATDSLAARIEGEVDGQTRSTEFGFRRVDCVSGMR
jgi:hypothetical protein